MAVFLFPGQGSQQAVSAILFKDLIPDLSDLFKSIASVFSDSILDTILRGAREELDDTCLAQPTLACTEIAATLYLKSLGVVPQACSGHSLGEIVALFISGALNLENTLLLIKERARLMSENIPEGGMAAVIGLPPDALEKVLPESVDIANYNGPEQTIISGRKEDLDAALINLKNAGARRVITLTVSGPFHSRYMKQAGNKLEYFLKDIQISKPVIPFLSSVSGKYESDPDKIRLLLSSQLSSPVQWTAIMSMLSGKTCLETGPGNVLQGLAKRIPNGPKVYSAATPDLCREFARLREHEYEAFD